MLSVNLYFAIVTKEMKRFFTYRSNILAGILSALFALGVRYALWVALFSTGNAQDSTLTETITFFVINDVILILYRSRNNDIIGSDIQTGDIATKLIKPYSYHMYLFSASHASAFASVITRTVPAALAALVFIGLLPPVSYAAFVCFFITFLLGAVIYALIDLIICYTGFWLTASWYLSWFNRALFNLFGGTVIPLWFYPGRLAALCEFLPFKYAVYQPMGFYLGRVPANEFVTSLLLQIFWIGLLFLIERAVWHCAQKKLTVQGG